MKDHAFNMALLTTVGLLAMGVSAGLRLNLTDSAPRGIWLEAPHTTLKRGMVVAVCPPAVPVVRTMLQQGYLAYGKCDGSVAPLLKTVAALPGDHVTLLRGSLAQVNGVPVPNTIARPSLSAWPDGEYTVQPNQLWIFSSYNANSFDSRYFGPVDFSAVRGEASPLLVDGNMEAL